MRGGRVKKKLIDNLGRQKWGFLRETAKKAKSAGVDPVTGLHRTGLEKYLEVIFPNVHDWVHDKGIAKAKVGTVGYRRWRPDYRSESRKLIVEFDGLQHYTDQKIIKCDAEKDVWYKRLGYKVVRIPYFIQLTNRAVKKLFGVTVDEPLFNVRFPSLGAGRGSPVNLCRAGINRMAREFAQFPDQYEINVKALKTHAGKCVRGVKCLESTYKKITQKTTK